MSSDRRRQSRKVPQSFTFLQLENDEGGHVVNLSEEGLCFESFSPIRTANPLPLWFSFNLRDRIEAMGQVIWTDSKNEIGGLAFINLSPAALEQIRAHFAEIPAEEAVAQVGRTQAGRTQAGRTNEELQPPPPLSLISSKKARLAVVPRPGETRLQEIPAITASEPPAPEPALPEASASAGQAALIPLQHVVSTMRSQFLRGFLMGILITTLIGILVFAYALRSQQTNAGREVSAPDSPVPLSPAVTQGAPSKSPSATIVDSSTDAAKAAPPPSNPLIHRKPNSPNPDQLWDAVQAGDAQAAVTLADLYLRGDGVPVNCAQARILLQFAAQKNNAEAAKKARELDKSGCPTP